jgi:hypothetical protein
MVAESAGGLVWQASIDRWLKINRVKFLCLKAIDVSDRDFHGADCQCVKLGSKARRRTNRHLSIPTVDHNFKENLETSIIYNAPFKAVILEVILNLKRYIILHLWIFFGMITY